MALLSAYPDRVVTRRAGDRERGVMVGGRGVRLSPTSAVQDGELYLAVELDAGRAGERAEAEVRLATRLDPAWLDPALMSTRIESGFDSRTERVGAWKRRYFLDLLLEESQAALTSELAASALAEAARQDPTRALPLAEAEVEQLIARLRCLGAWIPELAVPKITDAWILEDLEIYAAGKRSFEDLKRGDFAAHLRSRLDWKLQQALDREAPARISVPTGSAIALQYEAGKPPVLAVRIQEVFGLAETPRIAGGRVKVLMHLLAPNYRPQQVTDDLASFWKSAYFEVRKDLRARYPKHSWPEDPWNAPPVRKGRSSK
jgi:ATP-dependent helicase HrpB